MPVGGGTHNVLRDSEAQHASTQVPGGYEDSLSSNTELGRAVRSACDEIDTLSQLVCFFVVFCSHTHHTCVFTVSHTFHAQESQTLAQADELLKQLGLKTSIMQQPAAPQPGDDVSPTTQP